MSYSLAFVPDPAAVLPPTADGIHVLSCTHSGQLPGMAYVGRDLPRVVASLGAQLPQGALDLLAIAMAVTAADTFVSRRDHAADGWCRILRLDVPVGDVNACRGVQGILEDSLQFLSGDMWTMHFVQGPPWVLPRVSKPLALRMAERVALFSGGLDSTIGVLDSLARGERPLLVSHAYRGDSQKQQDILPHLPAGHLHLPFSANPRNPGGVNDVSMRTRSFNFLAVAAAAAAAMAGPGHANAVELVVPENGFIALNAPLTRRRLGSHSTRTTHPHFLAGFQSVLDGLGIPARIVNPYRHKTKGEMMLECRDQARLAVVATMTVSCGRWKRRNIQCGRCVPCLIRRAAFLAAGIEDATQYSHGNLVDTMAHPVHRDDVLAMCLAARRPDAEMPRWVAQSGALPEDETEYQGWLGVARRGLDEVAALLGREGVLH